MSVESVGQIGLDLLLNQQPFQRSMNGLMGVAGGWARKLGGLIGGALTIGSVAAFTKECLSLGSDLTEVQNVVDVTFGSMAEDVNQWAKSAMGSFGMSEKAAKEYMGTLGTMSKAIGFGEEAAYRQSAALTGLAADVASFRNISADAAFTKLQAVYTGETEALKSLGVVMTQTALDQYALANGFGKTTSQMTEMEKVELRLAFVTNSLKDASGDFARTSGSWANQTKILSVQFDALKASLGQGLINVLTPALQMLNQLIAKLQTAADAFRDFTANVFGDAGGAAATQSAADAAAALAENTESAAAAANAYKRSVIGIDTLNRLGDTTSGTAAAAAGGSGIGLISDKDTENEEKSGTAAAAAGGSGIGLISDKDTENEEKSSTLLDDITAKIKTMFSLIKGTSAFKTFVNGFTRLRNAAKTVADIIKRVFSPQYLGDDIKASLESLAEAFQTKFLTLSGIGLDIWDSVTAGIDSFVSDNQWKLSDFFAGCVTACTGLSDSIGMVIGGLFSTLGAWWEESGKPIFDGLVQCFNDVLAVGLDVFNNNIIPLFGSLKKTFDELWADSLQPLWEQLLSFFSTVGETSMWFWENVQKPMYDWFTESVAPGIQRSLEIVGSMFSTVIGTIADLISGLLRTLEGLLNFIVGVFTGDWEKAWRGVCDIFGGLWDSVWAVLKGVLNTMIDYINSFLNNFCSSIESVMGGIGSAAKSIAEALGMEWSVDMDTMFAGAANIPQIPKLASGGYVAANTPQLAVVGDNRHEGEIIAPESKIAEAVAAGISAILPQLMGAGGEQRIVVELDGEVLGTAMTGYQKRSLARGNGM